MDLFVAEPFDFDSVWESWWTMSTQRRAWSMAWRASGNSACPARVRVTRRVVRSNRAWPSCSSSCLMRAPKAVGVRATIEDARRKFRVSAAARKQRRFSSEGRGVKAPAAGYSETSIVMVASMERPANLVLTLVVYLRSEATASPIPTRPGYGASGPTSPASMARTGGVEAWCDEERCACCRDGAADTRFAARISWDRRLYPLVGALGENPG